MTKKGRKSTDDHSASLVVQARVATLEQENAALKGKLAELETLVLTMYNKSATDSWRKPQRPCVTCKKSTGCLTPFNCLPIEVLYLVGEFCYSGKTHEYFVFSALTHGSRLVFFSLLRKFAHHLHRLERVKGYQKCAVVKLMEDTQEDCCEDPGLDGAQWHDKEKIPKVHKHAPMTVAQLKAKGVHLATFLHAGTSAKRLIEAGYKKGDLPPQSIATLKDEGCDPRLLLDADFSASDLLQDFKFTAKDFLAAKVDVATLTRKKLIGAADLLCLKDLHDAGYPVKQVLTAGFSPFKALVEGGWALEDFKTEGIPAKDLKVLTPYLLLKYGTYTCRELREAGFTLKDLAEPCGKSRWIMDTAQSIVDFRNAGYTATEYKEFASALQLLNGGYSEEEVIGAGYDAKALREAGIDAEALHAAGRSSIEDFLVAGYTKLEVAKCGFTAKELFDANFSVAEMLRCGKFTKGALITAGYPEKEV